MRFKNFKTVLAYLKEKITYYTIKYPTDDDIIIGWDGMEGRFSIEFENMFRDKNRNFYSYTFYIGEFGDDMNNNIKEIEKQLKSFREYRDEKNN